MNSGFERNRMNTGCIKKVHVSEEKQKAIHDYDSRIEGYDRNSYVPRSVGNLTVECYPEIEKAVNEIITYVNSQDSAIEQNVAITAVFIAAEKIARHSQKSNFCQVAKSLFFVEKEAREMAKMKSVEKFAKDILGGIFGGRS